MPITRVELRTRNRARLRDNRQLRVGGSRQEAALRDAETIASALEETRSSPAPDEAEGEAIRREVNLTRSLSEEPHQGNGISGAENRKTAESEALDSPTTKKTFVSPPVPASDSKFDSTARSTNPGAQTHADSDELASILEKATSKSDAREPSSELLPEPVTTPNAGESRLDLITGEWTLYATTRSQRPDQFAGAANKPATPIDCPFCLGEESRTPDAVWSAKLDDDSKLNDGPHSGGKSDWSVRVVPNLYPAVTDCSHSSSPTQDHTLLDGSLSASALRHRIGRLRKSGSDPQAQPVSEVPSPLPLSQLFTSEPATGGHEVIIESPRHTESFGELNSAEIALVFAAYAERIRYWQSVPGVRHVSVFKNVGRDAGASLQHSHSQLIATNRVPAVVQNVTRRMQVHHAHTGSCMQCDLVRGEIEKKSRLVSQSDHFVAYCPYASRFPMQVRVTSKDHMACFGELRSAHIAEVARLVLRIVRWLEALRPGTAYNVLLHTCPLDFQGARESQHWALDIFPRMSRLAGFELATGAMINPMYPETAAKAFRDQARKSDPRYVLR